ncbi:hypothetical protein HDG42_000834 [Paraburkholderia sp. JPY171]|nr:hypothetical protein [Paraburkholderia atlantica]
MRVNRFYSVRHMIPYSFEELGVTCSIVISKNIFGPDFWEFLESFFSIPYMLGEFVKCCQDLHILIPTRMASTRNAGR